MESVIQFFNSIQIDFDSFWKAALILLVGTLLLGAFGRFVFGKRSTLNHAVSSSIGILFIYVLTIVVQSTGLKFQALAAPLPFVQIQDDVLYLFSFADAHYTTICSEILSMVILAFLVNLVDGWLPKGKNILVWLLLRCLTVAVAYLLHLVVVWLFSTYLPEGIVTYAPVILLCILIALLLTGTLKILVGALLTTVNPIIGGLYTFFFATLIGKQITKAVLSTAILSGIVVGLQYIGISMLTIASTAWMAYLPFLLILVVIWYIVIQIF